MKHEFNNRITAQRNILCLVNEYAWPKEELFSLSAAAIERWRAINLVDPSSEILKLVCQAAEKLFFLANKSQEQVSPEYLILVESVSEIANELRAVVGQLVSRQTPI